MAEPVHRPGTAPSLVERFGAIRTWLLVAIAIVLVGWALRAIGAIAVPVVFAFFLTLLVAPIDNRVAERAPGKLRWLGHAAAMATILLVLTIFFALLWVAAQQVVARFENGSGFGALIPDLTGGGATGGATGNAAGDPAPSTGAGSLVPLDGEPAGAAGQEGAERLLGGDAQGAAAAGGGLGGVLARVRDAVGSLADEISNWATGMAGTLLATAGSFLSALVLVFFLTLFMLVEAPRWRGKLATLADSSTREDTFDALTTIAQRLRRFLLVRLVLGLITAALYVGWLWIFGIDLLLVWGLLAVLLNFVPTIGSIIAGILPVLYAFVSRDFGTAVLVGIGILVIEQVMGNFVDPRVQGRTVSLSGLVVLLALLLWSWIWGIAGAFLAVPITITVLVAGAHVRALRPVALLVSDETTLEGLERTAGR